MFSTVRKGQLFEPDVFIHWSANLETAAKTEEDFICQSGQRIAYYIETCVFTDGVKLASRRPEAA
jgi:hypothetical protein